ncbi:MAG TPA: hypothetical protein VK816_04295 [Jatrophihabitantaceae bacterium]|nr:hypothetical protein [Jatrophihabitantaceae bacterium]
MKITLLAGAAVGYVLGARAGHERYEAIVRTFHKFAASQTVQSTAGVLQAQVDELATKVRGVIGSKLAGVHDTVGITGPNGHSR